jgi:hypothetical protein
MGQSTTCVQELGTAVTGGILTRIFTWILVGLARFLVGSLVGSLDAYTCNVLRLLTHPRNV